MRIILALISLLLVLGAWRAWRRSPIYSFKTNCQLAGVFLAMVAAIATVALEINGGHAGRSPAAKIAILIPAILLVLTGSIAATFRITDGPLPHLPRGVSVYRIHRRRLFPWIRGTTILLVILTATSLLAPTAWRGLPLALGALVLLLATSILYPLYLKARRFDRGMTALAAEPWIHWHYSPEQWQCWAAIQRSWERARTPVFRWKRDWAKLIFPIGILTIAPWILGTGGTAQKVGVMLACMMILLLSAAVTTWAVRCEPERRYRRMLTARREAYMGADGFYCSGEYSPWIRDGSYLMEATAMHDPPARLVLTFDSFTGTGAMYNARMIPIPEGCEGDLDMLQQQLRACCSMASVQLTARASHLV
jgi:hypothetical protein